MSAEIMKVHHGKHHAAYVNALNQAEEKVKEALAKGLRTFHKNLKNEENRLIRLTDLNNILSSQTKKKVMF